MYQSSKSVQCCESRDKNDRVAYLLLWTRHPIADVAAPEMKFGDGCKQDVRLQNYSGCYYLVHSRSTSDLRVIATSRPCVHSCSILPITDNALLQPSLNNDTVNEAGSLDCSTVILESAVRESGANGVRTRQVFRARADVTDRVSLEREQRELT